MPANLPPQYFDIEKKYREAREPHEKLVYLQQLLAMIPKHKGTEKLQADLKTKISKLKDVMSKPRKTKGSGGTWYQVEKQGAGQAVLVGLPNTGKSSLLNALTNANAEVGLYPFTTQLPHVGMMDFENVKIQIIDTPPLHDDAPAWLFGLYRNGDMLVIVLDSAGNLVADFEAISAMLEQRNLFLKAHEYGDVKTSIIVVNKSDIQGAMHGKNAFIAAYGNEFTILELSTITAHGIDALRQEIFKKLNIIRVYTKKIGAPITKQDPVVLKQGASVTDAAEYIHKEFKEKLKFARLWNASGYSGQRVEKNHRLSDGDVVEFHV